MDPQALQQFAQTLQGNPQQLEEILRLLESIRQGVGAWGDPQSPTTRIRGSSPAQQAMSAGQGQFDQQTDILSAIGRLLGGQSAAPASAPTMSPGQIMSQRQSPYGARR